MHDVVAVHCVVFVLVSSSLWFICCSSALASMPELSHRDKQWFLSCLHDWSIASACTHTTFAESFFSDPFVQFDKPANVSRLHSQLTDAVESFVNSEIVRTTLALRD